MPDKGEMIRLVKIWRKLVIGFIVLLGLSSCTTPAHIEVLQRGIEERPGDYDVHFELAMAYLEKGLRWEVAPRVGTPVLISKRWLKKAQRELEKTIELDPLSPEPHYWLKVIYTVREEYEAADEEVVLFNRLTARQKRGTSP
jgi:tetratricopeptide (TPR) repeat protein